MSGDFETLEINQPKIKYLKPEDNTEWLDKLINNIRCNRMDYQLKNKQLIPLFSFLLFPLLVCPFS